MRYIFIILILTTVRCAPLKETPKEVDDAKPNSEIVFLNYRIYKNLDGPSKVTLVNKIIVEGELKKNTNIVKTPREGDLQCIQLNKDFEELHNICISNPLFKSIEYVLPSGELGRKEIELDSADFSIRMQLNEESNFISIEKVGIPNVELLKFKL